VRAIGLCAGLALVALAAPAAGAGAAGTPKPPSFDYDVPVEPTSPWPMFRRDQRNTGLSPIRARYRRGERPWRFRTAKGVFTAPPTATCTRSSPTASSGGASGPAG